jgi:hypothetical protein
MNYDWPRKMIVPLPKRRHNREHLKMVDQVHVARDQLRHTADTLHHDRAGERWGSASRQTKAYQNAHVL